MPFRCHVTGTLICLAIFATLVVVDANADLVRGGGSKKTDCMSVFDAFGANKPAPPKIPKAIDCVDGDAACDVDGLRNGECVFDLRICLNSTAFSENCDPIEVTSFVIDHAEDNGDRRFDPDFQALQLRVDALGYPNDFPDDCSLISSVTVPLRLKSGNEYKKNRKKLGLEANGDVINKFSTRDKDKMKLTCRPEGDAIYLPTDLYAGTFDRIRRQVFVPSCATSACHDSESAAGGLILLSGAAYSQIHNVSPTNTAASLDGLLRITPGDETVSFLYRKITNDLLPGYGSPMPLGSPLISSDLAEIIRLWIIGDGTLGPAPETGWVVGTDQ